MREGIYNINFDLVVYYPGTSVCRLLIGSIFDHKKAWLRRSVFDMLEKTMKLRTAKIKATVAKREISTPGVDILPKISKVCIVNC